MKPFVKSNKNDFIDAEAIAEAVERKNMRFVPIKTDDQLASRCTQIPELRVFVFSAAWRIPPWPV